MRPAEYAKAITAAVVAFLTALGVALPDGITPPEWVAVALATVVALGAVWAVPNAPAQ
jgi:hypothetical protein